MHERDADSALETVVEVELSSAGQLVAVVDEDGNVLAGGGWKQKGCIRDNVQ